ncbi:unnamed protein product [Candida verbasci]|uniref:Uncharacterized protein n=1 Tax=Candida verbasci TaxID=1227364 RepID=A0A9W4TXG8_9ASCO|nr:unnamed protein product [Candida verbasci]
MIRLHNIPKSTRILLGILTFISGLSFILKYQQYRYLTTSSNPINFHDVKIPFLQLIPKSTIYNPWVLVTSIFAEITIISYLLSFSILFISSKFVERFWGYIEVLKFILIVGSITNLITVIIAIISNIVREDVKNMNNPLGGGISYYFGFLVVFKQLIPEHNIVLFQGLINFRIKHVPFALLIILTIWSLIISQSLYPAIPSIFSFFVSFIYLRFFQQLNVEAILPGGDNSILIGDASDTFQLVEFFPQLLKPYLIPIFNEIYEVAVLLGIITSFNDEIVEQSNLRAQKRQEQTSKAVNKSVAERRRQVALQVIEDRINNQNNI